MLPKCILAHTRHLEGHHNRLLQSRFGMCIRLLHGRCTGTPIRGRKPTHFVSLSPKFILLQPLPNTHASRQAHCCPTEADPVPTSLLSLPPSPQDEAPCHQLPCLFLTPPSFRDTLLPQHCDCPCPGAGTAGTGRACVEGGSFLVLFLSAPRAPAILRLIAPGLARKK